MNKRQSKGFMQGIRASMGLNRRNFLKVSAVMTAAATGIITLKNALTTPAKAAGATMAGMNAATLDI